MRKSGTVVMAGMLAVTASSSSAQQEVVASLPFLGGQTAGPTPQLYGMPNQEGDLWVIEEFTLTEPYLITDFTTTGWVHPRELSSLVQDVSVVILDDLPPTGNRVLTSTPGAGTFTLRQLSNSVFKTTFSEQLLMPGEYRIMWSVNLPTPNARSIIWHQPGEHAVGGGVPDSGLLYFPASGLIRPIPRDLLGNGQTGANFVLEGIEAGCYPDCDQSGALDIFDFLCFQNSFVLGEPYACDCDPDPACDIFDFLCFQDAFVAGCP